MLNIALVAIAVVACLLLLPRALTGIMAWFSCRRQVLFERLPSTQANTSRWRVIERPLSFTRKAMASKADGGLLSVHGWALAWGCVLVLNGYLGLMKTPAEPLSVVLMGLGGLYLLLLIVPFYAMISASHVHMWTLAHHRSQQWVNEQINTQKPTLDPAGFELQGEP